MGSDSLSNHIRLLALEQRRPHFFSRLCIVASGLLEDALLARWPRRR